MINPKKQQQLAEEDKSMHEKHEETFEAVSVEKKSKKKMFMVCGVVLLVIAIAVPAYMMSRPGIWDGFAQCLTDKGAVMQGEEWCQYTQAQKGMFGKSFKYINYQIKEDLAFRPTWVIDGQQYQKVQSFERLGALTGCPLSG